MSDPKSRVGEQDRGELMKLLSCSFIRLGNKLNCGLRIHANGGTCAQIAKPDMLVVYGGTVTRELVYQHFTLIEHSKLTAPNMNFFIRHSLM